MSNSTMTSGLVTTWVTTVDSRGRSHLEAHWVPATSVAAAPAAPTSSPAPNSATEPAITHAA